MCAGGDDAVDDGDGDDCGWWAFRASALTFFQKEGGPAEARERGQNCAKGEGMDDVRDWSGGGSS